MRFWSQIAVRFGQPELGCVLSFISSTGGSFRDASISSWRAKPLVSGHAARSFRYRIAPCSLYAHHLRSGTAMMTSQVPLLAPDPNLRGCLSSSGVMSLLGIVSRCEHGFFTRGVDDVTKRRVANVQGRSVIFMTGSHPGAQRTI